MKRSLLVLVALAALICVIFFTGCANKQSTVDDIQIYTSPTTVYVQGQQFMLSGGQIVVKYEDGTEKIIAIDDSMISSFQSEVLGRQVLQITYEGKTTSLEVIVVPRKIANEQGAVSLVVSEEFISKYIEEQDINATGLSLRIKYEGGAYDSLPVTRDMIIGYNAKKTGDQKVSVKYINGEDVYLIDLSVTVSAKKLTGIEVSKLPDKLVYYIGDPIDLTGGMLFLKYDNGYPVYSAMKDIEGLNIAWDNAAVSSRSTVTLTYQEKTAKFDVQVILKDILEFNILSSPTASQLVNTSLNLNGLSVEVTYTNGTKEIFVVPSNHVYYQGQIPVEGVIYSIYAYGYDMGKIGEQNISLGFYSAGILLNTRLSLPVIIHDKSISNIEIYKTREFTTSGQPLNEKPVYTMTNFRPFEAWSYVLVFNNGEKYLPRPLTAGMVSGSGNTVEFGYNTAGTVQWEIEYQDDNYVYDGYYSFNVLPLAIDSVQLMSYDGNGYLPKSFIKVFLNNALNPEGSYIKIIYNSGRVDYKPLAADMVIASEFLNSDLSTTSAPIRIIDEALNVDNTASVPVVMVKKVSGSLGITKEPINLKYILYNEEDVNTANRLKYFFNYSGLEIAINYEGESETKAITDFSGNDWQFSFEEWTDSSTYGKFFSVGRKAIFLTYVGLEHPETQGVYIYVNVTNDIEDIEFPYSGLGTVYAGAKINLSIFSLILKYENGLTETVPLTEDMIDYNPRNTTEGVRNIKITYRYGSVVFSRYTTVNVSGSEPVGIEVFRLPNTVEYVYNQAFSLDRTGMIVNLVYQNGTRVLLNPSEYECDNFSSSELGERIITVTHLAYQYTASFVIEIVDATASSIVWVGTAPIVNIQEGVDLMIGTARTMFGDPLSSARVKITYSDESETEFTLGDLMVNIEVLSYNKYSAVRQFAELVYKNKCKLTLEVQVNARVLTSISSEIGTFAVIEYSDLDLSAAKLRLTFDYGLSENTVPLLKEYLVFNSLTNPEGYKKDDTTLGWREVKVVYTYKGITCNTAISVNVIAKQLQGIGMKTIPKVRYIENEALDATGGIVVLYYNNGTTEELDLTTATVNISTATFNINAVRFDNSEFSGLAKLQTIYVNYIWNGTVFETDYDILMMDRKYLQVNFNSSNQYEFFYGDLKAANLPTFTVTGYNSFGDTARNRIMPANRFLVEYIRYEDRNAPRDPEKDYTAIPREAGNYLIIISYDSAAYGDNIHNSFVTGDLQTKLITIKKKKIFIELDAVSKIYGTANPVYHIKAYGTTPTGAKSLTAEPFAFNDTFISPYFANQNANLGAVCYDPSGNALRFIKITAYNESRTVVAINNVSAAGNYLIVLSSIDSKNYDIVYENSAFVIEKRKVAVYPQSVSVEYGTTSIMITYTTGKAYDDYGMQIEDSGLYDEDTLTGALNRINENVNNVGQYKIIVATLHHPNYQIMFNQNMPDRYVTIYKRNIYIKANSLNKVYGEDVPAYTLQYFRDETCTDLNAFAFTADRTKGLGAVSFVSAANRLSAVGSYTITPVITRPVPDIEGGTVYPYDNYNIIYINGVLQVLPRPIIVTAHALSKAYGEADPALTYQVSAVPGIAASGLIVINAYGEYDTLKGLLSRQSGDNVARYAITVGTLVSLNPNYNITFNKADFSIQQKKLYIEISPEQLTKVYDGRLPSIDNFSVKHKTGETLSVYSHPSFNPSLIGISFDSATHNTGSYFVVLTNTNPNYDISFIDNREYYYVIAPREVNIQYINLPDNMPYKGTPYVFSAVVRQEFIQYEYNSDGSIKTDINNNFIKDTVEVTLSPVNPIEVDTYSVYPVRLSNNNYKLSDAAKQTVNFSIVKRELIVEVLTAADYLNTDDGITYESIYDGQPALLYEGTHFVVHNNIEGASISVSVRVINPLAESITDTSATPPSEVRYEAGTNHIISYQIYADNPTNKNFTVTMMKEYKYKIVPRSVNIVLFDSMLSKNYNNKEPEIDATMFYVVTTTNLSPLSFSFTFNRTDGDTLRKLSDVGTYEIGIHCSDRNHIVTTIGGRVYTYVIKKINVNVEINPTYLKKTFNGQSAMLTMSNLRLGTASGITPKIKNYYDNNYLFNMQAVFDTLKEGTVNLISEINTITFDDQNYALMLLSNLKSSAEKLYVKYDNEEYNMYMQAENLSAVYALFGDSEDSSASTIFGQINLLQDDLNQATFNMDDAKARLAIIKELAKGVYQAIDNEFYYIAFRFTGSDPNAVNVGQYAVTMTARDYNKNYIFLNAQSETCYYTIENWSITIKTENIYATYGEKVPDSIPYQIWDGARNITDTVSDITGTIMVDLTSGPMGYYSVGTFSLKPSSQMSANNNYNISYNLAKYIVQKANLVIQVNTNIGTANDPYWDAGKRIIRYGDIISYDRLKFWSIAYGLVSPQPGQPADTSAVVIDAQAVFTCLTPNNMSVTNASAKPGAGTYVINASGFSSYNYNISVLPGMLTVSKAILSIKNNNSVITRQYGYSFEYNYSGFVYDETVADLGSYVAPVPENPGSAAFNLLTDSGLDSYVARFVIPDGYEDQLQNYVFDVENVDYYMVIDRAPLNIVLTGINLDGGSPVNNRATLTKNPYGVPIITPGGSSPVNYITAKYGDTPAEDTDYRFVYNGFRNSDQAAFSSIRPTFSFIKDVDIYDLGQLDYNYSSAQRQQLFNYTISLQTIKYVVTQRPVTIKLGKTISVMKTGPSMPYVGPYLATYNKNGEGEVESITVSQGQYFSSDIIFGNFYGSDNADQIFQKYTSSDSILDPDSTFIHNVVLTEENGVHKITLQGFTQINTNNINYVPNYEAVPFNVYSKVVSLNVDPNYVMLENDAASTLRIVANLESGDSIGYLLTSSDFINVNTSAYPTQADINGSVSLTFKKTYTMNAYTGPTSIDGITVTNQTPATIENGNISATLPVRLYKMTTAIYDAQMKNTSNTLYNYGSAVNALSSVTYYNKSGATVQNTPYDRIDTSFKLAPLANQYSFALSVNGTATNGLLLRFMGGFSVGNISLVPVSGGVEGTAINLGFSGIDVYDGYTHNVRVYYNRQTNNVYVILDGAMSNIISLNGIYTPVESSPFFITMNGVKAWFRHFELAKQGYADHIGSLVLPAVGSSTIQYVISSLATATINLKSFFTPNPTAVPEGYSYLYYFDGVEAVDSIQNNVGLGLHKAEMVIMYGTSVYNKYSVNILVTASSDNGYVTINSEAKTVTPSNPIYAYGYTRNNMGNPDDLTMANINAESTYFPLSFDKTSREANYRSMTVTFSMDKATYNNDYRSGSTTSYLHLMTNTPSYYPTAGVAPTNATYYGVSLGIKHIKESALTSYYETTLYLTAKGVMFHTMISDTINWGSGDQYTVQIFLDYVSMRGDQSFKVIIYKGNEIVHATTVNSNYSFANVVGSTAYQPTPARLLDVANNTTRSSGFNAVDHRVKFINLSFGDEKIMNYDYLVNGSFAERLASGNTLGSSTFANSSTVSISDARENMLLSSYNKVVFKFAATPYQTATNNITFFIAASEKTTAAGKGIGLIYNGTTNKLSFSFYAQGKQYALQTVATGLNLLDGNTHTVFVEIDRAPTSRTTSIYGITTTAPGQVSTVKVTVDGVQYSTNPDAYNAPVCFPYTYNLSGWRDINGNAATVSGETYSFLAAYNYTYVNLVDTAMTVYSYQTGYSAVSEHLGSAQGPALT